MGLFEATQTSRRPESVNMDHTPKGHATECVQTCHQHLVHVVQQTKHIQHWTPNCHPMQTNQPEAST